MYRLLAVALFFGCTSSAFAYGTVTATVASVRIDADGRGMVFFSQAMTGTPPSCVLAAAYNHALAFDTNTAGGKSILAMVLAAKATGDTISAIGANGCNLYGNSSAEDWSYGQVL